MKFRLSRFEILTALLVAVVVALWHMPSRADGPVVKMALGANAAWFDGAAINDDIEGGLVASASLSPHLTAKGSAFYGFRNGYRRWSVGPAATVSDADNPNFDIAVGIQYQGSAGLFFGPNEWAPNVSVGYRPWPSAGRGLSRLVFGLDSSYGLTTNAKRLLVAARYGFKL